MEVVHEYEEVVYGGTPANTVKSITPLLAPLQSTLDTTVFNVEVNSVNSISIEVGVIGQPALFMGVRVKVTVPIVPAFGVQSTDCGVFKGAVAVPSIVSLEKTPFGAVQTPINVSVT